MEFIKIQAEFSRKAVKAENKTAEIMYQNDKHLNVLNNKPD